VTSTTINGEPTYRTVRKRLASIKPSPENLKLYAPIDPDDPELVKLADSIAKNGLREPLIVTEDGWLVSGHRRHAALKRIGQIVAPCRVLPVRRDEMTTDEFVVLLREHNLQRHKSVAEQVRETLVDIDPEQAQANLRNLRDKSVYGYAFNGVPTLKIEGEKVRHAVSGQKADHVKYIKQVVFTDRRKYWPLSVRAVHYALLNYKFLRNIPRKLKYANDDESYQATCNLITRLRLNGVLPWESFDDGTRPITTPRPFEDVREFIGQCYHDLFVGYWRDLLQTQPNHVEVVCEKNTVYHMVLSVTEDFQLPTSSGRGFNSIDPWHDLVQRYRQSGKQGLIVIVLSDFDPEGEMIPQVGGRTLRDDFGVENPTIIKAGVTREQIEQHHLPKQNFAKETSSNFDWFVKRNDGDDSVYELEALDPQVMLDDLKAVITSTLDMNLFNAEARREQDEAAHLEAARKVAREALKGLLQ
jgi:hypothetical protein